MRKQIIKSTPVAAASIFDRLDIESIATVLVTSGLAGHPIENVFNAQRGRGGSGWISEIGGEKTFRELLRQEFHFAPAGPTFEREDWAINVEDVTHLWLQIKPDKSSGSSQASLTSLGLR